MPARLTAPQIHAFRENLIGWYGKAARDLPWRRTGEAYRIWVSEVMLQQTRVNAVIAHYEHFVRQFPTLVSLALAPVADVLAAWSGLGYYRRARMLHKAAQHILIEHEGRIPNTCAELMKLPGVGAYTAAAVASIAFNEPVAVVDGNVERVAMRLLAMSESGTKAADDAIRKCASSLLDKKVPGLFNQAIMELGATVCLPQNPLCDKCPVQQQCRTRGEHPSKPRAQMRSMASDYALLQRQEWGTPQVLLVQRPADSAKMPSMWELPQLPGDFVSETLPRLSTRHAITNTNYYVRVFDMTEGELGRYVALKDAAAEWVAASRLPKMPLTGLARKVLMRSAVMKTPQSVIIDLHSRGAADGQLAQGKRQP